MPLIPWKKPSELRFIHSRLNEKGEVVKIPGVVPTLSLRMAVVEACVQRQGEGFDEMSICLVDGTSIWRGPAIAELASRLSADPGAGEDQAIGRPDDVAATSIGTGVHEAD